MTRLFISYRRADSQTITGRIYDRLLQAFGGPQAVFKDVDSIPVGVDFKAYLDQQIARSDAVLVIIGPQWLTIADESGRRRLDSPDDFVRLEIEFALRRGMLVIPVLVGGAAMPAETSLPKSLRALAYRNAALVRDDPDFHHDMDRLIGSLQQWTATGQMHLPRPASLAPPPRRSKRWSIRGTLRLLRVALIVAAILLAAGVLVIALDQTNKEKGAPSPSHDGSSRSTLHIVNLIANPPSGPAPVTVEFGAAVDPPGEYAMQWEFGDGAVSEEPNPVHMFARPGRYSVRLTVHHRELGSDSRVIDILVKVFCGPGDRVSLRLRAPDGIVSPDRVRAGIEDFMRNCPNVEIAPEYPPADMYGAALITSMMGGDIPDVFMFEMGMSSDLVDQGLLFDLRPFLSEEQAAQNVSPQGRVVGLPYGPELWRLGVASRSRNPEAAAALVAFLGSGTW